MTNRRNPMLGALAGERYEAQVPDTLDLADRMGLAVNALTNVFNPKEKHALYFRVQLSCRPPLLRANHAMDAFLNIPPKFIEALALCRLGSGSDVNIEMDAGVLADQVGFIGEDGLGYAPTDAMVRLETPGMERPFAEVWGEGRMLIALSMLTQLDEGGGWRQIGQRKIDQMLSLTAKKDGYRYLWTTRYRPGDRPNGEEMFALEGVYGHRRIKRARAGPKSEVAPEPAEIWPVIYSTGALGHGSALFHRVTAYEPALELARGIARWAVARIFCHEDGHWDFYHFHHSLYSLIAVLEYALAVGDKDLLSRVDACYRFAREMGDPLIGYYPEVMPGFPDKRPDDPRTVEICEVADMLVIALKLTQAGVGDYWDDVDRWTRNMFAEGQMTSADFVEHIPEELLTPPIPDPYADDRDIAARSVGSFWGWMRPNDGLRILTTEDGARKLQTSSIMHCCTGNGARTLYYVWDSIVTRSGETTRVNLLLNRASPWLDVESFLPVEGRVVLHSKTAQRVVVRMPEWAEPAQARALTEQGELRTSPAGRELDLGLLKAGSTATLTFPVSERTFFRLIGNWPYKLTMRGSNVVAIEPRGEACPLYEKQPRGVLVAGKRFIPSKRVVW